MADGGTYPNGLTKTEAADLNAEAWAKQNLSLSKDALERIAAEIGDQLDCFVPIMVCNEVVAVVRAELEAAQERRVGDSAQ